MLLKSDAPYLISKKLGCLLFADDAILLSTSAEGLQRQLDNLEKYCEEWGLTVNTKKTKIMVFNSGGRPKSLHLKYGTVQLECVSEYKYLGVLFTSSGVFTKATENLYHRGLKAFFKLRRQISHSNVKCSTYAHLFDTMVKPVLLYGSEIWAPCVVKKRKLNSKGQFNIEEGYDKLHVEKLHSLFCRTVPCVSSRATKMAVKQGGTHHTLRQ